MKLQTALAAALLSAYGVTAQAYDWVNDWPTHYAFSDGTDVAAIMNYQYDHNDFSDEKLPNGTNRFIDSDTNRRKEFGFTLKKKGVYDAIVYYDFQSKLWLDVFLRVETKAVFGSDYGKVRFGYSKTPVGFEAVTSSRADSFMELAMPEQAMFEGRRTGIDWALERDQYIFNVGYYFASDIQGDNDGNTAAARFAWTPMKKEGDVLHLGVSASFENPDRSVENGRNATVFASARLRARPDAGLTAVRLVDSGAISRVDDINRLGLEGLWIRGPLSVQGEYLNEKVKRDGFSGFTGSGYYVFGSYILTGESRPYAGGNVANPKPKGSFGAWEVLLRYDELDLNDSLLGGKEHNWTVGLNWYLTTHFKFQANYVRAYSDKGTLTVDPKVFELRAQVMF